MTTNDDILANETVPDRRTATRLARTMGCEGAHRNSNDTGWHPCESPEALRTLITGGAKKYRAWKQRQGKSGIRTFVKKPDDRKKRKYRRRNWETLGQRGIQGIHTLPGGGLVSAKQDNPVVRVR